MCFPANIAKFLTTAAGRFLQWYKSTNKTTIIPPVDTNPVDANIFKTINCSYNCVEYCDIFKASNIYLLIINAYNIVDIKGVFRILWNI